ncbi:MAG: hypothetical protein J6R32_08505 [Bacteroidales bacterium]|nr:hypothetical protein [Bacteroidales bacterium]
MKPIVKQKQSTVQDIMNKAQAGGGGTDSYTKAEADAKFETQTDAATTYLSKSDAASTYQPKADMTDYVKVYPGGYIIVNGIRVYVASSAPTGDIPEGSAGIGW